MPGRLKDKPLILPDLNGQGHTALRQWRLDKGYTGAYVAELLEISPATLYRYEDNSYHLPIAKANEIVKLTRGAVRYRDLVGGFVPAYA